MSSSDPRWDVDTMDSPVGIPSREGDHDEIDGASSMLAAGTQGAAIGMRGPVQATVLAPAATTADGNGAAKDGAASTIDAVTAQVDPVVAAQETATPAKSAAVEEKPSAKAAAAVETPPARTTTTEEPKPAGKGKGNRKSSSSGKSGGKGKTSGTTATDEGASSTEETTTTEGEKPSEDKKAGDEKKGSGDVVTGEGAGSEADETEVAEITSPQDDPDFLAVKQDADVVAKGQRRHAPTKTKVKESHDAAEEPQAAIEGKGQARHVEKMEKAPTPLFDRVKFKNELSRKIESITPKKLEDLDNFKENNAVAPVKRELEGQVRTEKARSEGPLQQTTKEKPSTAGVERKPVTPLQEQPIGKAPGSIGADRAVPKPRNEANVEAPLQANSKALDQKMSEANVTDEQLAKSNEPTFAAALDAKKEAQVHAVDDAVSFRQLETNTLTNAKNNAVKVARTGLNGMHGSRSTNLKNVGGDQKTAKGKDEAARAQVATDIQGMFNTTKQKVEGFLSGLDNDVKNRFDQGAGAAQQSFESFVETEVNLFRKRRYSGLDGKAQWFIDLFRPVPEEIGRIYNRGRERYLQQMNDVLDGVVDIIAVGLTNAKTAIQNGKSEIAKYVKSLPGALQKVGREAAADVGEKFKALEQTVDNKQAELIDTLARRYQESVAAIDTRIEEMKEANKGFFEAAVSALTDVIKTIENLAQMLNTILAKIADVVGMILMDPIGFLGHLIDGIAAGFNNFVSNIGKHIISGLFGWLTGAMGPMGITIPENLFSLEGIFGLVMQVLGLSWNFIRTKAVKLFGEPVVNAMEKGVEIFMHLREGPAAMWEHVKEEFSDLKEMVLDQIQSIIVGEVIEAGIKWILSLLSPASAFVKAAMMIYDFLSFIFTRAAQIADFINSLLDAVAAIAKGSIGGAASMVENALARSIPVIIGMLASLLGISDLVAKVQKIIQKIHARIEKAIEKVLAKARKLIRKLRGKGGDEDNEDKMKVDDTPDERTDAQKKSDLHHAVVKADRLNLDKSISIEEVKARLGPIKNTYKLTQLELVTIDQTRTSETTQIKASINPGEDGTTATRDTIVHIDIERPDFRPSLKDAMFEQSPESHHPRTEKESKPTKRVKSTGLKKSYNESPKLLPGLDRRHIVSSEEMRRHVLDKLNGKPIKKAKEMLEAKGYAVHEETNDAIEAAATSLFRDFFNDLKNLWIGASGPNRSIGEARDYPEKWLQEGNEHKIEEHIAYISKKYMFP